MGLQRGISGEKKSVSQTIPDVGQIMLARLAAAITPNNFSPSTYSSHAGGNG